MILEPVSQEQKSKTSKTNSKTFVVYGFDSDKLYCIESNADIYSPQYYDKYHKEWLQKVQQVIEQDQQKQGEQNHPLQDPKQKEQQDQQSQNQDKQSQDQGGLSPTLTEDQLSNLLQQLLQMLLDKFCLFGMCLPKVVWIIIAFLAGRALKKALG